MPEKRFYGAKIKVSSAELHIQSIYHIPGNTTKQLRTDSDWAKWISKDRGCEGKFGVSV